MRVAVFAADAIGLAVMQFLRAAGDEPVLLAVDDDDRGGKNGEIRGSQNTVSPIDADALRAADIDLVLLAWWPKKVSAEILAIPRLGALNLHPSLLPHCRGKHYYFWSIVERRPFGVTIHWASDQMDAGPIAYQRAIDVSWSDTGKSLYEKSQIAMMELFKECWPRIKAGDIPRVPQEDAAASFHWGAAMDQLSLLDLEKTYRARELLDILRARTFPNGGARFIEDGVEYTVRVQIEPLQSNRQ